MEKKPEFSEYREELRLRYYNHIKMTIIDPDISEDFAIKHILIVEQGRLGDELFGANREEELRTLFKEMREELQSSTTTVEEKEQDIPTTPVEEQTSVVDVSLRKKIILTTLIGSTVLAVLVGCIVAFHNKK